MLVGLVGAPSAGKSSFFSAATMVDVAIASYPFTTIDPNRGIAFVRVECVDKEFGVQCNPRSGYCRNGTRYVPVELMDVAGLVPNAHKGEGKGNEFLADLSRADALIHVIDAAGTTNEKGEIVPSGSHDPAKNVAFLEEEINFWYYGILKRNWAKFAKMPFQSRAKMLEAMSQNLSGVGVSEKHIDAALSKTFLSDKRLQGWTEGDMQAFAFKLRELSKPIVVAANKVDLPSGKANLEKLKLQFPDKMVFGCSAQSELALKKAAKQNAVEYFPGQKNFTVKGELNEKQKQALDFIQKNVLDAFGTTGVQEVLERTVFEVLKYIAIFPGGVKKLQDSEGRTLPDCFLLPQHSTALDFAFKIHTDLGKGFIRAVNVKTKTMIGKVHELKHRDVIEIIANA